MSKSYLNYSSRSGLSDSDVLDIRARAANSSIRNISREFQVPKSTVHDIISGKTWSHVPQPAVLKQYNNYTIFPDGRVYSNRTSKFLANKMDKSGNLNVELLVAGKRTSTSVASLVAKAFLGKKNVTKISFKDGDSTNVHFTNIA